MDNITNKELLVLIEQATAGDKAALETVLSAVPIGSTTRYRITALLPTGWTLSPPSPAIPLWR